MIELEVDLGARSYPIYIGDGIYSETAALFNKRGINRDSSLLIITDEHVAPLYLHRVRTVLEQAGYKVSQFIAPPGEKSKSLELLEQITTAALGAGLDRRSTIIALGGGVVGDLAGFAASSYMRGIRFVQLPTTVQAHDSSVGGKVGVNHRLAKNIIGAFLQPELVLYDTSTLRTLPMRELRAGLGELLKEGLIWDSEFVDYCDQHADKLLAIDAEVMKYALFIGCKIKALVVSKDEREGGLRGILNLGHTFGHAIEAVAGYGEFLHGEAISIGMVGSALLSSLLGNSADIVEETRRLLRKFGLPVKLPASIDDDLLIQAMWHDKKVKNGQMVFVIPTAIGKVEMRQGISEEMVRETLALLKREA